MSAGDLEKLGGRKVGIGQAGEGLPGLQGLGQSQREGGAVNFLLGQGAVDDEPAEEGCLAKAGGGDQGMHSRLAALHQGIENGQGLRSTHDDLGDGIREGDS